MGVITEQLGRELAGRYRLEAGLGTGASAHVYAAFDTRLARRVAVKVLHPGLSADRSFLRRFAAEAQAVAALNHPNILQVFDWGEEEDGPFLVLEHLPGGSLRDLLDAGGRLSPLQAAAVGAQAARGLAYAHHRGFIHRDIKPENLLFDERGSVRIADFGLARALAEAAWTEPVGAVLGTARYASPEQAEGRPLDGRSDVYSLALVLYEAVTGRVPFSADTTVATLMARIGAPLPTARELGPLAPVLAQAAISEPMVRLEADELAEDLELLLRSLPAPPPLPLAPATVEPPAVRQSEALSPPGKGAHGSHRPERAAAGSVDDAPAHHRGPLFRRPAEPAHRAGSGVVDPLLAPPDAPGGASLAPAATADLVPGAPAGRPRPAEAGGRPSPAPKARPRRRLRRVALGLLVLALAGGAAAGGLFAERRLHPTVHTPSLSGASLDITHRLLSGAQLRLGTVTERYSPTVPAGEVISQRPAPGRKEPPRARVDVVISEGHAPVAVPALVHATRTAALAALGEDHLAAAVELTYNETVPGGEVISASPASGTAPFESTVHLVVSAGPAPRTIPDLPSSTTWSQASAAIAAERLEPVEQAVYSNDVPAGDVVSTSPAEGAGGVPVGTKVTVVVSLGPELVAVPPVGGDTIAQAVAALGAEDLKVTEQVGPPFATKALTTDPAPGSRVRPGTSVTLYVST